MTRAERVAANAAARAAAAEACTFTETSPVMVDIAQEYLEVETKLKDLKAKKDALSDQILGNMVRHGRNITRMVVTINGERVEFRQEDVEQSRVNKTDLEAVQPGLWGRIRRVSRYIRLIALRGVNTSPTEAETE